MMQSIAFPSDLLWKDVGELLYTRLHELLTSCWKEGTVPKDLRDNPTL